MSNKKTELKHSKLQELNEELKNRKKDYEKTKREIEQFFKRNE